MKRPPLREVRKIAVLRPSAVGDFMFALPALHALEHAYPEAELVFLGQQWHSDFLAGRPGPVDRLVVVPPVPGVNAPTDAEARSAEIDDFLDAMRGERFDLALQMYGGGRYANPLVQKFDARFSVGMRSPDAAPLDRSLCYGALVNRRMQLLELAALGGARYWPIRQQLQVTAADRALAAALIPATPGCRLVIVQPGASDVRRRWPAARFAALADALVEEGALVAVNGNADESAVTREVLAAMRHAAIDLSGVASLRALCGLMERCALVVSNDTGPLHMALALGRPAAGIYWFTNLLESAPLCQQGHRTALSTRVACPVCGVENLSVRCSHEVSFVDDVPLEEVTALAIDLFRASC
jgi:ADP-heptose:LPS heptosyltransferase